VKRFSGDDSSRATERENISSPEQCLETPINPAAAGFFGGKNVYQYFFARPKNYWEEKTRQMEIP
jgi:hypothetical protein